VRIGKRGFAARIKGNIRLEFGGERLTSFAGLELLRRYVHDGGLHERLAAWSRRRGGVGDLPLAGMVRLLMALIAVGGRRLRHVRRLDGDPMVRRFAGLNRLPSPRSLARRLGEFRAADSAELDELIIKTAADAVVPHRLARMTIDIDGSVLTCGQKVRGALRGYNPHNRKNPSYYPITAILAQTGHVIGHRNRPGNVHDSEGGASFVRQAVGAVRTSLEHRGVLEMRCDSAFFRREILETCDQLDVEYAIKVPFWPWLNLRAKIAAQGKAAWQTVSKSAGVEGLWIDLEIEPWGRTQRVAIFRTHRDHQPVKGQLDLFNPDDGYWEHSAVATNRDVSLFALWSFINGHGVQEKTTAELKSGLAYADIPTADMFANVAWQKINLLTHNLLTSFQLETLPQPRRRTAKRTAAFIVRSARTIRFELLNIAGRFVNVAGIERIRLANNPAVQAAYDTVEEMLPLAS
jgi:hypothetical protein